MIDTQKLYHENNDGTGVEIGTRMRKGRYSERIAKKPEELYSLNLMAQEKVRSQSC